jgi:DNA-binding transcriptional LysR family regulator
MASVRPTGESAWPRSDRWDRPIDATATPTATPAGRRPYEAALAGLRIIQAPRWRRREAIERGLLIEVLPELTCAPMPVSLVQAHGRNVPKRVTWLSKTVEPFVDGGAL